MTLGLSAGASETGNQASPPFPEGQSRPLSLHKDDSAPEGGMFPSTQAREIVCLLTRARFSPRRVRAKALFEYPENNNGLPSPCPCLSPRQGGELGV